MSDMKSVLLLNGPNLNLLGTRKPEIYGKTTLSEIVADLEKQAKSKSLAFSHAQFNGEGELITAVQQARGQHQGMIINAGGYSHTSIALRDAVEIFDGPVIEVHLSNLARRESFRHHSYLSEVSSGVIFGMGPLGYRLALDALEQMLFNSSS